MSAAEETLKDKAGEFSKSKTLPIGDRILNFLSSVRFGVSLLITLVFLAFLGMIIIQQNVNGFETYYLSLTAEKTVYGWLKLFDIYHSWYFSLLLVILSLNIVLASIDHFPASWKYISTPKLTATPDWLLSQKQNSVLKVSGKSEVDVAEKIKSVFAHNGLKPRIIKESYNFYASDENGNKDFSKIENKTFHFVFGESGRLNRLGAYIVHVFLLTLFLGHFVALQSGFDADVQFIPGQTTNQIKLIEFKLDRQERYNVDLPFEITCTDIQQKLINPGEGIDIGNTLDWRTQIKISDPEYGETVADVSLNKPFSYRGYRFFQASAITQGMARTMSLELTPEKGGDAIKIDLARDGSTNLPDGTKVDYEVFLPDFTFTDGQPDTRSGDYNNPAVVLNVTSPGGEKNRVFAFAQKLADNIPVGAPKAGYKWRLASFEKSPLAHVLSIKYDPFNAAFVAWYIGGFGLIGALIFVFFISHKRVWALIEKKNENDFEVILGGDANRSQPAFEDKFNRITDDLNERRERIIFICFANIAGKDARVPTKKVMKEVKRIENDIWWIPYLPAIMVIVGAFAMLGLRLQIGSGFISDTALMMLALASYLLAALFQLTNLYAPSEMARKIGSFTAILGVFFNLSSWLVRWIAAYDFELQQLRASGNMETPWIFRYIPFANLYDLSLAFAFGAGITTLLLANRRNFQFLSAFTLPLAALILTLARFIGGEHSNLMPILDSYWRPIHVGVASLSYGVALVCFAIAVIYLLKDKVKVEAMAIWSSVFALGVIASISKLSVFTEFVYRAGLFTPNPTGGKPFSAFFRLDIPYVGWALVLAGILLLGVIFSFLLYLYQNNQTAKTVGHILLKLSLVVQIAAIAILVSGIKSTTDVYPKLQAQLANKPAQYLVVGKEIAARQVAAQQISAQEFAAITPNQFEQFAKQSLQMNGSKMYLSLNTNPVELAGLLTALAGTFFVILFAFRTDNLRERLPSLDSLDGLMYRTACLAFAGLAMLLITGAIWANESWGRPWGFDSKETGALVAWLTYAGFLHTRISRGWKGRSSAYFAIFAFLFVIFTYLGVSYLLPGLHSYA